MTKGLLRNLGLRVHENTRTRIRGQAPCTYVETGWADVMYAACDSIDQYIQPGAEVFLKGAVNRSFRLLGLVVGV